MAAWMAGGRHSRRSMSAAPRPAWRLIPVGVQSRHVLEAPARQSSMRFLRSSTGPEPLQGILEVSTIRADRSVNHQLGSYSGCCEGMFLTESSALARWRD